MKSDQKACVARREGMLSLLVAIIFLLAAVAEGAPDDRSVGTLTLDHTLNSLTEPERAWLRDHPVIRVAQDPGWPPVEFADERGEPSGMTEDYLKLIEQRLGVKFERVRKLSWQAAYARLKRWEIDMTTSVVVSPERAEFWAFTKPYIRIPIAIATGPEVTYIGDLRELAGRKVALVEGYAVNDWIPRDFPEIRLVRVKTAQEGLAALQRGKVFAFVESMLVLDYYTAKLEMTTLKIAGQTPYVNAQSMAVRKDWAILAGILDKALDSISETERDAIYRKWLPIRYKHGFNYARLWQTLAISAVILLGLVVWIRKLVKEIRHRKKAEAALRESEAFTRVVLDNLPVGIAVYSVDSHVTFSYMNDSFPQCYRTTREKLADPEAFWSAVYEEPEFREQMRKRVLEDCASRDVERMYWADVPITRKGAGTVFITARDIPVPDKRLMISMVWDVTQRKLAEVALRESEERFRTAFDDAPVGMCLTSPAGRLLRVNHALCQLLDYAAPDLVARSFADITHPDDLAESRDVVRRMLAGEADIVDFEKRYLRRDGQVVWATVRTVLVRGPDRRPLHHVTHILDITARKQALESLRAREALLNEVGTVAKIGGWEMDLITRKARWTQGTYDIVEIDYADPIPGPDEHVQYYLPEYRSTVEAAMKNLIEKDIPLDFEAQLRTAKGHIKWVRALGKAVRHEDRCVRAYGTIQDITERKQAQAAVRESEERFRTMANSMPQLAWIARADGYIFWYNQRWYEYTGTTPEQMEGWGWQSVHDLKMLPKVMAKWQGAIVAGQPFDMEFPLRGADGQFRTFLTRVQPFKNSDGVVMQWFGTNTDVDELKQAEEKVRQLNAGLEQRVTERTAELAVARDHAEAADRTKSAFLATMSHELRTPLNSIIGFTGLILQGLAGPLNAEQTKQLRMVKESGQHLLALINDVLDISKIEARQIEIQRVPFDLREAIQKVAQMVSPLAGKKHLSLVVRLAPGVGPITSDRRRVEQILLNLLSNAIKFTERGDITLTVKREEVMRKDVMRNGDAEKDALRTTDYELRISVTDTGSGIKPEDLDKLFQPFRQLDSGLTRQHEGTGLGLAICKRLAERLGGTITVESEWGKGSTFGFTLPMEGGSNT